MDYNGKLILAPMVRVGTHPMRLLAAGYGADIVYSEELVDKRVMATVRRVNESLGTIDFLDKGGEQGGRVMFRTSPEERERLVFQIGTADATTALAAASVVAGDVACLDVNMGCPKQFSLQGGMGAALLRKPEVAEDILKTLRRNLHLPVSCKIRLLDDPRDTVELARRLAACGISALAVHGRTTQQRPREPANWGPIRLVVDALQGVPVIANGDVMSYSDAHRVRQETGCAGAMVARAAMWNASVFRPAGFLHLDEVQKEYVRLAVRWGNALQNTKYCLKEMADAPVSFPGRAGSPGVVLVGHEANVAITRARDETQLCQLVALDGTQLQKGRNEEGRWRDRDRVRSKDQCSTAIEKGAKDDLDRSAGAAGGGAGAGGVGGNDIIGERRRLVLDQVASRKRSREGEVVIAELPEPRQQKGLAGVSVPAPAPVPHTVDSDSPHHQQIELRRAAADVSSDGGDEGGRGVIEAVQPSRATSMEEGEHEKEEEGEGEGGSGDGHAPEAATEYVGTDPHSVGKGAGADSAWRST